MMLILEYVAYGDLLGYLRKSRGMEDKHYSCSESCEQEVTSYELLSFAQQIASGMSFLASKKVRAPCSSSVMNGVLISQIRTIKSRQKGQKHSLLSHSWHLHASLRFGFFFSPVHPYLQKFQNNIFLYFVCIMPTSF